MIVRASGQQAWQGTAPTPLAINITSTECDDLHSRLKHLNFTDDAAVLDLEDVCSVSQPIRHRQST